jgi:ABC-type cobalt transport system substrate-binding protein
MTVNQRLNNKEGITMFRFNHRIKKDGMYRIASMAIVAVSVTVALLVLPVSAQEVKQKVFGSPEEAMKALVETVQAGDKKGVLAVLGPEGEDIIDSGDAVQDKNAQEQFVKAYQEKVDYVKEKEDRVSVILGNDNWPFAIPIIRKAEGWMFDTKAGREEMLNRRVGRNELSAIQVCLAYVEAQREYASTDREQDGIIQYAQKVMSDPYRRNGLYWEVGEGEIESPLGPFIAQAAQGGYIKKGDKPIPYHGYYYKILKGQGKSAPGGAFSYVINGHMVAGFALVAWPAEYEVSGVMTFIVNQNGTVYQKDLGPKTEAIVKTMTLYNPDRTWKRAQ